MTLNRFQLAEVNSHIDPELNWIVCGTIDDFFTDKKNFNEDKMFNRFALYRKVGKAVASVIAEREGHYDEDRFMLSEREAADAMWNAYREVYGDKKQEFKDRYELVEPWLLAVINAALLRVRVPIPEDNGYSDYWPFGQEGGFCNPMKLKLMDD